MVSVMMIKEVYHDVVLRKEDFKSLIGAMESLTVTIGILNDICLMEQIRESEKILKRYWLYPKSPDKRNKEPPDYDIRSRTRICLFTDQLLIKFMNFGFYRCQILAAPDDL